MPDDDRDRIAPRPRMRNSHGRSLMPIAPEESKRARMGMTDHGAFGLELVFIVLTLPARVNLFSPREFN